MAVLATNALGGSEGVIPPAEVPGCTARLAVFREKGSDHFSSSQLTEDLARGWGSVISTFSVVAEMESEEGEQVLVFSPGPPEFQPCEGFSSPLGLGDLLKQLPGDPCEAAEALAVGQRVRDTFPRLSVSCRSDKGGREGIIYLGGKIGGVGGLCSMKGWRLRVQPTSSRGASERCDEFAKRLREDLKQKGEDWRLPIFVVVNDIDVGLADGKGKVVVSTKSSYLRNGICLPGNSRLDWMAYHEFGHLLLQREKHPDSEGLCEDNIMVAQPDKKRITAGQRRELCKQRIVDCRYRCDDLFVPANEESCLTPD